MPLTKEDVVLDNDGDIDLSNLIVFSGIFLKNLNNFVSQLFSFVWESFLFSLINSNINLNTDNKSLTSDDLQLVWTFVQEDKQLQQCQGGLYLCKIVSWYFSFRSVLYQQLTKW